MEISVDHGENVMFVETGLGWNDDDDDMMKLFIVLIALWPN